MGWEGGGGWDGLGGVVRWGVGRWNAQASCIPEAIAHLIEMASLAGTGRGSVFPDAEGFFFFYDNFLTCNGLRYSTQLSASRFHYSKDEETIMNFRKFSALAARCGIDGLRGCAGAVPPHGRLTPHIRVSSFRFSTLAFQQLYMALSQA